MRKEDGSYFEAELLRPLSWIYRHHAQPGAVIQLNMPEMYVVGAAEVLSISDCPPIDPGDGPVVISTFKNVSHNVLNIYVEGETEPIGVTAGHPIWSEDRQAFVHTDQLQPGERLRSAVGKTVRITSIEIRAGPEAVYNLEVAGEHVYSVTNSGLLVHNSGPCYLVPRGYYDSDYIGIVNGSADEFSDTLRATFGTYDVLPSSRLVSQFDTINPPTRGIGTLDEVSSAISHNADVATELARRAVARGRISGNPRSFGTRAHLTLERLNDRLNRRLIDQSSSFRVATEEFRDAAGIVINRRARGSIGADAVIRKIDDASVLEILDLKTHGGYSATDFTFTTGAD